MEIAMSGAVHMRILPFLDPDRKQQQTGLGCPACPGTLAISGDTTHVRFRCLVGHVYSLRDLIEAKEERVEERLWSLVTSYRELAELLRCAIEEGLVAGSPLAYEQRAKRATQNSDAVERILREDLPLSIEDGSGGYAAAEEP